MKSLSFSGRGWTNTLPRRVRLDASGWLLLFILLQMLAFPCWGLPPDEWPPAGAVASGPLSAMRQSDSTPGDDSQSSALVRSHLTRAVSHLAADGSPRLQQERLFGRKAPPSLQAVLVMCDFSDSLLYGRQIEGFPVSSQSEFYYAAHDSLYFHHMLTDVATYFDAVSDGQFTLNFAVLGSVANLNQTMGFYGDHPDLGEQPILLAADAIAALDAFVDFSLYDTVILVHAGAGEETDIADNSPEQIFSTYLSPEDFEQAVQESLLTAPYIATDDFPEGEGVRHVLILPETEYQDPLGGFGGFFGSLGVYCFEVGLRLGMLSLSDFTPPGRPDSQGIGEFGLMGFGLFVGGGYIPSHPCAFNKMLMGWLDPYPVRPEAAAVHHLTPVAAAAAPLAAARVDITGREYWLLEYRLQDPDGNGVFSWQDDLNQDGVPNFTAIDDNSFVPVPFVDFFDPQLHVREWLTGGEFDFFMSENTARPAGVKGAGSGVYIWHIDEGVIQDAFDADGNVFNADPKHKGVDLEEADGIQDLDSRVGSPYILGGDDDSFRGEGSRSYGSDFIVGTEFGPSTEPPTDSAGGAPTFISFDQFSNVVQDSSAIAFGDTFIMYSDSMSFRCRFTARPAGWPERAAERVLAGIDLHGSHLLAVDLDGESASDPWEIVVGGQQGEVFALDKDLNEYLDWDVDPATLQPLAIGTDPDGIPVAWNGAAAAGNLQGDPAPEIVLTAAGGLYAFHGLDGGEVADGDGDPESFGLLTPLMDCRLPPILLPLEAPGSYVPERRVVACVVELRDGYSYLRFIDGAGDDLFPELGLGSKLVRSTPQLVGDWLVLATADTAAGEHEVLVWQWSFGASPPAFLASYPLRMEPSDLPLLGGPYLSFLPDSGQGWAFVVVPGRESSAQTVWWNASAQFRSQTWPTAVSLLSPLAPFHAFGRQAGMQDATAGQESQWASAGLAFQGPIGFSLATSQGVLLTGWPVSPRPVFDIVESPATPSPLRAELGGGERRTLFQGRDGRLYLYTDDGELMPGWPVAGPADAAGSSLLLDLDLDEQVDLVAAGTFERIVGIEANTSALLTEPVSRLQVWTGLGEASATTQEFGRVSGWPMWQGSPWRVNGGWTASSSSSGDELLTPGSHICYPNPLLEGALRVRAISPQGGRVLVKILNLEGEEVASSGSRPAAHGEPFEIVIPLDGVASGLYLCRLKITGGDGETQTSVVPFAVAH